MDIDSLGEGKVEILYDNGLINDVADLYKLNYDDLLGLEKVYVDDESKKERKVSFKEKSSQNIIDGIGDSLNVPFERVLFALGIRYVGETVAKTLTRHYKNIDALASADMESLTAIHEIGERIAASVIDYFNHSSKLELVSRLKTAGLQMKLSDFETYSGESLKGKSFVISGTYEGYTRDEIKENIERNGGKFTSSLSKNTNFLLAGDNAGPSKLEKAASLGITVIDLEKFLKMIE